MHPSCPRCGAPLPMIDGEPPAFCPHCGLPQLRISQDALSVDAPEAGSPAGPQASSVDWPRALRLLAAAAVIGVVVPSLLPDALSAGLAPGMSLLMTPVLMLAVVFTYSRRRELPKGAGGRMGAVLGLLMGALLALLTGIAGFVLRYHFHSHAMDDHISQALAQMSNQMNAQSSAAGPMPPAVLAMLQSPEFRAGSFILGHVMSLLLLVGAGAVCGSLAGTLLRPRRQPVE